VPAATYRRRVEFAETDAAGMVHFSIYFRYMEEAEHAIWRKAGMDIYASRETHSWPRISAKFDYKAPLRFQDEFDVRTEMGVVTRSTIQWAHVLMRAGQVIGLGTVTAVYVAKQESGSMKSAAVPEDTLSKLRSALQS